jgi:hypothetical protein
MTMAFEQQPRESAKAFAAFNTYLNLGPERSLAAVAQKLRKSKTMLKRWSAKFDWVGRVDEHAAHLAKVERQATEGLARSKAAEWLQRQQALREREWSAQERCIEAAEEALRRFLTDPNRKASLGEVSRLLDTASKLGRLSSGMATDHTETKAEMSVTLDPEWELALKKVYGEKPEGKQEKLIDV